MSALDCVISQVRADSGANLERARRYVRQVSVSGENRGITEMAAMVADDLRSLGAETEIVSTQGFPVVYAELNVGAPTTVMMYGMYDTQPADEPEWQVDPFAGDVMDWPGLGPCLVARGASNSKGPLAAFISAVAAYRKAGVPLPVNLIFMVEGEEELGSPSLPSFMERYGDRLRKADAAIFPAFRQDREGTPIMQLGYKGIVALRISCRGGEWGGPKERPIHGMNGSWVASPVWRLVRALDTLVGAHDEVIIGGLAQPTYQPDADDLEAIAGLADTLGQEAFFSEYGVRRFKYDKPYPEILRHFIFDPVCNIDGIQAGYTGEASKANIPDYAYANLNLRLLPGTEPGTAVDCLKAHLAAKGFGPEIEIKVKSGFPASKVPLRSLPARALLKTYEGLGRRPQVWPLNTGSAPFYLFHERLGIPYVTGGLGHGERAHAPNELFTLAGYDDHVASLAAFLFHTAEIAPHV